MMNQNWEILMKFRYDKKTGKVVEKLPDPKLEAADYYAGFADKMIEAFSTPLDPVKYPQFAPWKPQ